jgi:hypothetical protein
MIVKQSLKGVGASTLQPRSGSSNFHLIGPVKQQLSGRHFDTDADVWCEVRHWPLGMSPDGYCKGMEMLSHLGTNAVGKPIVLKNTASMCLDCCIKS